MALADHLNTGRLIRIATLIALGIVVIFTEAAPLGVGPEERPSPDMLLCVVAYWSLRRPGSTPMLVVFALGLMRDLLTDVPVGAGALSLVIASEMLKGIRRKLARASFALEWLTIVAAAVLSVAMQWMLVFLSIAHPPYLSEVGNQVLHTALIYPVFAITFRWLFRITWRRQEQPA